VPLLLETGQDRQVDRVLVVDVPEDVQVERAMARDGADEASVRAILAAQASRSERLRRADDVIGNTGPPEALAAAVDDLHRRYLALAEGAHLPAAEE
jgi:dephospho-CoA kinase